MADVFATYRCTNCQEDIEELGIRCCECDGLNLCLQCFACGAEIGPHKNDHSYQFMDTGSFSIFGKGDDWTAREEIRLLDATEQYGFGNWEDISKHIETKGPDDAKEEYVTRYINGNIGKATWSSIPETRNRPKDHTCPDNGPLSPSLTSRMPPLDVSPEEASQLGYMPHRDDYEKEFDNEAETLVSQLFVNSVEDEDIDIALKLAHVDMYTRSLRERARRKRVVRDFQLVSQYFSSARKEKLGLPPPKKKVSKEEKELQERMRVFTQFHTAQEHEQFLQNLQKERELKFRVKELARYRRNGLTRHEECLEYEKARYMRERRKEKKSGSSGVHPSSLSTACKTEEKNGVAGLPSPERKSTPLHTFRSREDSSSSKMGPGEKETSNNSSPQGLQLLSLQEKKLCSSLKLKPSYYLAIKTVLIKDHLQRRKGLNVKSVVPEGLEKSHWQKIVDYMILSGWITAL